MRFILPYKLCNNNYYYYRQLELEETNKRLQMKASNIRQQLEKDCIITEDVYINLKSQPEDTLTISDYFSVRYMLLWFCILQLIFHYGYYIHDIQVYDIFENCIAELTIRFKSCGYPSLMVDRISKKVLNILRDLKVL